MFPTLDVLIPVYNEASYLEETLKALCACKIPSDLHIRLVFSDNASDDESLKTITAFNFPFETKIFPQSTNLGGRGNWEFLLDQVQGDFFIFLDAHDLITSDYFIAFQDLLKSHSDNFFAFIGAEIALNESQNGYEVQPKEWQYFFSENSRIRVWQLIFELGPNTIVHSIFKTSDFLFTEISHSKVYTFDHLITHIGLLKRNLWVETKVNYIRRYRKVVGVNFTHEVASGLFESRVQRVIGSSRREFSDKFLAKEIFQITKSSIPFGMKFFAWALLKLKYSDRTSSVIIFRILRKIFRTVTPWKSQRKLLG